MGLSCCVEFPVLRYHCNHYTRMEIEFQMITKLHNSLSEDQISKSRSFQFFRVKALLSGKYPFFRWCHPYKGGFSGCSAVHLADFVMYYITVIGSVSFPCYYCDATMHGKPVRALGPCQPGAATSCLVRSLWVKGPLSPLVMATHGGSI